MIHRAFIAIPVTDEFIKTAGSIKERLKHLPFRWTAPENLHLTLMFLGNVSEQGLENAKDILQRAGERHSVFSLEFSAIVYGPPNRPPRMIWLSGRAPQELLQLINNLENELARDSLIRYNPMRPFREMHLTLARRKGDSREAILPKLNEPISLAIAVNKIQLITSELRPEGPRYTVVKEVLFGI